MTTPSPRPARHSRFARMVARALLALYPRHVRDAFGADMRADFLDSYAARRTAAGRARFLLAAIADALRTAAAERRDARGDALSGDLQPARRLTMHGFLDDVRFSIRGLRNRPGFVAAVVLTLALGLGANIAVFSLVDAIFLRPVGVADAGHVVSIFQASSSKQRIGGTFYPVFTGIRDQSRTLSGVAAMTSGTATVQGPLGIESVMTTVVSGSYFDVLGTRPFIGRLLNAEDDGVHGASPFIVISHRLWQRWFGDNQDVVGKTVTIADRSYTIVGVAPASFRGTSLATKPDIWAPMAMLTSLGIGPFFQPMLETDLFTKPELAWVNLVARVRPGVKLETVDAELNQIVSRIPHDRKVLGRSEGPVRNPMWTMPLTQSAAMRDREALVRFVRMMSAVVAATLLLACANVANLLLVRASERTQELGVRAALGAGRARLVRQLFVESVLLASIGALVGIGVAVGTLRALSAFTLPGAIVVADLDLSIDTRLLAFSAIAAVATALVFGLLPAVRASRLDLAAFLRNDRGSRPGSTLRNALVATQAAVALVLLIGAALFARSLRAGLTTDIGFEPRGLVAVTVNLQKTKYTPDQTLAYYRAAEARLRTHAELQHVAIALHVPLAPGVSPPISSPDAATAEGTHNTSVLINTVSNDYFATLGVPVVHGRMFTDADVNGANRVAVVNEATARHFWGSAEPVGRTLRQLMGGTTYTVIGVVKTTRYRSLSDADELAVFFPLAQEGSYGALSVIARSDAPATALSTLRRELTSIDPAVAVDQPRLVASQIDEVLMPQRFGARLFGIFAAIALVVAAIGVQAIVAYGVSLRRQELGIRIALGAGAAHIHWTVLRGALAAVAIGIGVGLVAGALGSPTLATFLYGIRPLDPAAYVLAAAALFGAALFATIWPARRAARSDPVASMRAS